MKRQVTILMGLIASLFCGNAVAQGDSNVNLSLEARGDLQGESRWTDVKAANTGFRGKQLNLRLTGNITDAWSYTYRQRMGKPNRDDSYFDAVDHVNLTYTTGAWAFTGGKQTVAVGGYEYDRAPIDFYFGSEYWYNMACYQWGMSAQYNFGNDALKLQLAQSPFRTQSPALFGGNLLGSGSHGWIDVLHSVNVMEYAKQKFVGFLALGHQFHMGNVTLQLDWMSRTDMANLDLFGDFSVMGDLSWAVTDKLNLFGKASYDVNGDNAADLCVLPGTELTRVGAGLEYFPIEGSRDIRFHGAYSYAWGKNGNGSAGTVQNAQSLVMVGVTWRMDILNH